MIFINKLIKILKFVFIKEIIIFNKNKNKNKIRLKIKNFTHEKVNKFLIKTLIYVNFTHNNNKYLNKTINLIINDIL